VKVFVHGNVDLRSGGNRQEDEKPVVLPPTVQSNFGNSVTNR
jgi:hypothetical protein